MIDTVLLHTKEGNRVYTKDELIANAKEQEADGVKPMYAFLDAKCQKPCLPAGWLVYSTWDDGAGVVYKNDKGNYIFVSGWQGEFGVV